MVKKLTDHGGSIHQLKKQHIVSAACYFHQLLLTNGLHLHCNLDFLSGDIQRRLHEHESNPHHREAFGLWKETERRVLSSKTISDELNVLISSEKQRWRDILKHILSCIKFLVTQNLPFRGHDEQISGDSTSNPGNFLALMQLLGQYDPVLRSHLEHCLQASYATSYLSPAIPNEFIDMLASTVHE